MVATVSSSRVEQHEYDGQVLSARELIADPFFAGVPPKFLLWQQGLALRRVLRAGQVLCRQGDPGNTAFLIKRGKLLITAAGNASLRIECGPEKLIVGEMSCLTGKPRTANISALTGCEVWEIRRNVLDRVMRTPSHRERFETIFREHSLDVVLRESDLFRDLDTKTTQACIEFLRPRLSFVRVSPGQFIFRQGDPAEQFYLVRLGFVAISRINRDGSPGMIHRGPGTSLGEIGLLALAPEDIDKTAEQIDAEMTWAFSDASQSLTSLWPSSFRTASCTALDHVEMARVSRADFLRMIRDFPVLRRRLIELSLNRLRGDASESPLVREYVRQGLYQGQSLLVLDLDKCTRCDECTRACVQQHGRGSHGVPLTRMLRQGLHFGNYLVATACRSCKDAYCMVGCPVDAIHRGKHQQIIIEDHCIGCGLCANNCPFGNIFMVEQAGEAKMVALPKAATCDLCDSQGKMKEPVPRCVYACPHDAAHRMSGEELLQDVMRHDLE